MIFFFCRRRPIKMIPIREVKAPILKVLYIFFCLNGIHFGSHLRVTKFTRSQGGDFVSTLVHMAISGTLRLIHLYTIFTTGQQLVSIAVYGKTILHVSIEGDDQAGSSALRNHTNLPHGRRLETSLKPITQLIFRFYMLAFFCDRFFTFAYILVRGERLIELLKLPLYKRVDRSWRAASFVIVLLVANNVMLLLSYIYGVANEAGGSRYTLIRILQFALISNQYFFIYICVFYAYATSWRLLEHFALQCTQSGTSCCCGRLSLEPLLCSLSHNLDSLYSILSPLIASKIFFNLNQIIFSLLHLFLFFSQSEHHYYKKLFLTDLAFSLICDLAIFQLATCLASSYDSLHNRLLDSYLDTLTPRTVFDNARPSLYISLWKQPKLHCACSDRLALIRRVAADLEKIGGQYKRKASPRLFHLDQPFNSLLYAKLVLFAVNFAIILFQTESI